MTYKTRDAFEWPTINKPGRNLFNFDDLFTTFGEFATDIKFPKYNFIKYNDDTYDLEVALAGYSKDNLSIELSPDRKLTIATLSEDSDTDTDTDTDDVTYLTRGIASRNFKVSWNVDPSLDVGEPTFIDGMLRIPFTTKTPKKPKVKTLKIA